MAIVSTTHRFLRLSTRLGLTRLDSESKVTTHIVAANWRTMIETALHQRHLPLRLSYIRCAPEHGSHGSVHPK